MRVIGIRASLVFTLIISIDLFISYYLYSSLKNFLPAFELRPILLFFSFILIFFISIIVTYRIQLLFFPLRSGKIKEGSTNDFNWQVNTLYWLLFFNHIILLGYLPIPISGIVYRFFGSKIGKNSFSGGVLFDPSFITLGEKTLVGHRALLIPHIIEGSHLELQPIELGDNVTIGAYAIVLAGTRIKDGAIVGANSVVKKNSIIGENEIWAGNPAKFIALRKVA